MQVRFRNTQAHFQNEIALGRELTTSDLVKNLLLKKIKAKNVSLDRPKVIWNRILEKFDNYGIEDAMDPFLFHHWLSQYDTTTQQKLFSRVKNYIDLDINRASSFLWELQENCDYYSAILNPSQYVWSKEESDIRESLESLKLFNVRMQTPIILAFIRAYKKREISLRFLRQSLSGIESFHFIFNAITSKRSSGSISSIYNKHAQQISNANSLDKIQSINTVFIRKLKGKIPEFEEFEVGFSNLLFTNNKTRHKKIIQYILKRFMGKNLNGLPVDYRYITIEHLLPQSQGADDIVGSIGNLILLDRETNSEELKDLEFFKKISILKDKGYPLDSDLLQATTWTDKKIAQRTKNMAYKAYHEVWKII